jgi:hypothetical protein
LLNASMWLIPASLRALAENPRSSDQAVAALLRRVLLEDAPLELTPYGSLKAVWRNGGASTLVLRSVDCCKACSLFYSLSAPLLASTSSCLSEAVHGKWCSTLGGDACVGCSSPGGVQSLSVCPHSTVSPGTTTLPVMLLLNSFGLVSLVVVSWFPAFAGSLLGSLVFV